MPDIKFDYKSFLKTVPNRPGSYRMYSDDETVIYVGKAKDLKKRLSSYFLKEVNFKTNALIHHIHHMDHIPYHNRMLFDNLVHQKSF